MHVLSFAAIVWEQNAERDLLIIEVLSNSVYQSLHLVDGVLDILTSDLGVARDGIALNEIERRNPLTNRPVRLEVRVVGDRVVEQRVETVDATEIPSARQQKGFQKLLYGLLETKSRELGILVL